jgi:hypothetical protein
MDRKMRVAEAAAAVGTHRTPGGKDRPVKGECGGRDEQRYSRTHHRNSTSARTELCDVGRGEKELEQHRWCHIDWWWVGAVVEGGGGGGGGGGRALVLALWGEGGEGAAVTYRRR